MIEYRFLNHKIRVMLLDADAKKREIISVIIAFIIVVIVYFLVPSKPAKPTGIFLPTHKTMTPLSANNVNFYSSQNAPLAYQTIGYVSVMLHSVKPTPKEQTALLQHAKQLAAKAGANGVINVFVGHTLPHEVPAPQAVYVLRGTAIYYVPNI